MKSKPKTGSKKVETKDEEYMRLFPPPMQPNNVMLVCQKCGFNLDYFNSCKQHLLTYQHKGE